MVIEARAEHRPLSMQSTRVESAPRLGGHAAADGRELEKVAAADELHAAEWRHIVRLLATMRVGGPVAKPRDETAHLLVEQVEEFGREHRDLRGAEGGAARGAGERAEMDARAMKWIASHLIN